MSSTSTRRSCACSGLLGSIRSMPARAERGCATWTGTSISISSAATASSILGGIIPRCSRRSATCSISICRTWCKWIARCSAGCSPRRCAHKLPSHLDALFFCNSGTESVEGAIKFARAATKRPRLVSLEGSFHGLTQRRAFHSRRRAFSRWVRAVARRLRARALGDLAALQAELQRRDVAAFIIEPVQGKGVHFAAADFYREAQRLCRAHGTLLICDEVQTGLGRTGKWWGFEHWDLEPDIITIAKSLSGGYVPCAAVVDAAGDLSANLQPPGPLRCSFLHFRPQQSRDGRRSSDLAGDRGGASRRTRARSAVRNFCNDSPH